MYQTKPPTGRTIALADLVRTARVAPDVLRKLCNNDAERDRLPHERAFQMLLRCDGAETDVRDVREASALCYDPPGRFRDRADSIRKALKADNVQAPKTRRRHAPAGGRVHPVRRIVGTPNQFVVREKSKSNVSPLSIVVEITPSVMTSADILESTGAVQAACCMLLSQARPVQVYTLFQHTTDRNRAEALLVRLPTAPVNLQQLAALIGSTWYRRTLHFANIINHSVCSHMAEEKQGLTAALRSPATHIPLYNYTQIKAWCAKELNSEVLYLPSYRPFDENSIAMKDNPTGFVQKILDEYAG